MKHFDESGLTLLQHYRFTTFTCWRLEVMNCILYSCNEHLGYCSCKDQHKLNEYKQSTSTYRKYWKVIHWHIINAILIHCVEYVNISKISKQSKSIRVLMKMESIDECGTFTCYVHLLGVGSDEDLGYCSCKKKNKSDD